MKRNIIALCLMTLFAQGINAQGFFKQLGKALKESAKTVVTGGAVTQETQWGKVTVKHLLPSFEVKLQNVARNGDNLQVTFLVTNTSSQKFQLWDLRSRKVFDNQGNQYKSSCMVGNEWLTIGDAYNYFESKVPTKVVCSFGAVPKSSFVVSMIKFETSYTSNGKRYEAPIEIRNITVPEYKPTAVASPSSSSTSSVFKGCWGKEYEGGRSGIGVELFGKLEKREDHDKPVYGMINTWVNNGSRIDDDFITKITVNGNTATIEYECGRAMDVIGKAQLTVNPQTGAMTIKVLKCPERSGDGCYIIDGVTMKKEK